MPREKLLRSAALCCLFSALSACDGKAAAERDSVAAADSAYFADNNSRERCEFTQPHDWQCRVNPAIRVGVRMRLDTTDTSGANPLKTLEIRPIRGDVAQHSLDVSDNMGEIDGSEVTMMDLDGDGFGDMMLELPWGHPNNTVRIIWLYQPATKRFVIDSTLTNEANVTPDDKGCVRTSGYLGMSHQTDNRLCLQGGNWIEVSRHDQIVDEKTNVFMEYFYERRGDSLVLVKKQPLEP